MEGPTITRNFSDGYILVITEQILTRFKSWFVHEMCAKKGPKKETLPKKGVRL